MSGKKSTEPEKSYLLFDYFFCGARSSPNEKTQELVSSKTTDYPTCYETIYAFTIN